MTHRAPVSLSKKQVVAPEQTLNRGEVIKVGLIGALRLDWGVLDRVEMHWSWQIPVDTGQATSTPILQISGRNEADTADISHSVSGAPVTISGGNTDTENRYQTLIMDSFGNLDTSAEEFWFV